MAMAWPRKTTLFEVGPRDGLQAETLILSLDQKVLLVEALVAAGLKDIEVGSFVKADWIPALADTRELMSRLNQLWPKKRRPSKNLRFWTFVPNRKGLEDAIESGVDGVSLFVAASDTFNQKNINRTQSDSLKSMSELLSLTRRQKVAHRVYVSTITFCPYEGRIEPGVVLTLVKKLAEAGAKEIVLSDTTGDANPRTLRLLIEKLTKNFPAKLFSLHLHDTRGLALANALVGLSCGISRFDSSIAGLGGCPFAPGATGNLATEDLANMLLGMGVVEGLQFGELVKAGSLAEKFLQKSESPRAARAFRKRKPEFEAS